MHGCSSPALCYGWIEGRRRSVPCLLFQETCVYPSDGIVLCAVNQCVASVEASLDSDCIAGVELADLVSCVIGCCAAKCQVSVSNSVCL